MNLKFLSRNTISYGTPKSNLNSEGASEHSLITTGLVNSTLIAIYYLLNGCDIIKNCYESSLIILMYL